MTQMMCDTLLCLSIIIVLFSMICCFIRMMIGPTLPDRVLALDLTANLLISFIAIFTILTNQSVYIDVVLALALIIFLTTVAFANLMMSQDTNKKDLIT